MEKKERFKEYHKFVWNVHFKDRKCSIRKLTLNIFLKKSQVVISECDLIIRFDKWS